MNGHFQRLGRPMVPNTAEGDRTRMTAYLSSCLDFIMSSVWISTFSQTSARHVHIFRRPLDIIFRAPGHQMKLQMLIQVASLAFLASNIDSNIMTFKT